MDLILMDVQMPMMNGLEAAVRIRELEADTGDHIPVICLTVHAFEEDQKRCLEAGTDGYLAIPLNMEGFYRTLKKFTK